MKVCIYGAGAVGGHVAARLAHGGAQVSLIARPAACDAIRGKGLRVVTPDGELEARVAAASEPRQLGPQDVVVVTVKAPALPEVAEGLPSLLADHTAVVFAMNGIPWWYFQGGTGAMAERRLPPIDPHDTLWHAVDRRRVIGAVVNTACEVMEAGVVRVTNRANRLVLGEPDGTLSNRVGELAGMLRAGGMTIDVTRDIRSEIWKKLTVNLCGVPMMVLTQSPACDVYTDPACAQAALRVGAEVTAIARALGCTVGLDLARWIEQGRSFQHKASMARDLELGRSMEIDAMLTVPLALARELGVATPTLDLLAALTVLRARAAGLYRTS
jgi:2-dehydropantoate 2-reductase